MTTHLSQWWSTLGCLRGLSFPQLYLCCTLTICFYRLFGFADDSTVVERYEPNHTASRYQLQLEKEAMIKRLNFTLQPISEWDDINLVNFRYQSFVIDLPLNRRSDTHPPYLCAQQGTIYFRLCYLQLIIWVCSKNGWIDRYSDSVFTTCDFICIFQWVNVSQAISSRNKKKYLQATVSQNIIDLLFHSW